MGVSGFMDWEVRGEGRISMNLQQILQTMGDRIYGTSGVKTMYGSPMVIEGKTLIPVGRVAYGFGAAGNSVSGLNATDEMHGGHGTGVGGGIVAHPVGVIEITASRTRYIPFRDNRKFFWGVVFGVCVGFWVKSLKVFGR